jgi:3',5'-cyclic-AMP phosphodiesterase
MIRRTVMKPGVERHFGRLHLTGIIVLFLIAATLILTGCLSSIKTDADKSYYQIVILSDIHLPGNILTAKEKAIQTINSWKDVDMVAVIGDIVAKGGSPEEFAFAKKFLGKVNKPLRVVGGNHDYIYPDSYPSNPATGHTLKEASPAAREKKLERFKETWGLKEIFYSEKMGGFMLVFLTPDDLVSNNYTEMSDRQLAWLDEELGRNRKVPTIVFFHGPLEGTYTSQMILKATTPDSYNAEPAKKIREILLKNQQVFLWVSGHVHIAPPSGSFKSEINLYEKQIWVIHNADMNGDSIFSDTDMKKAPRHDTIWTNSIFLYPDRVVVKTYDHKQGLWLKNLERTIKIPSKL